MSPLESLEHTSYPGVVYDDDESYIEEIIESDEEIIEEIIEEEVIEDSEDEDEDGDGEDDDSSQPYQDDSSSAPASDQSDTPAYDEQLGRSYRQDQGVDLLTKKRANIQNAIQNAAVSDGARKAMEEEMARERARLHQGGKEILQKRQFQKEDAQQRGDGQYDEDGDEDERRQLEEIRRQKEQDESARRKLAEEIRKVDIVLAKKRETVARTRIHGAAEVEKRKKALAELRRQAAREELARNNDALKAAREGRGAASVGSHSFRPGTAIPSFPKLAPPSPSGSAPGNLDQTIVREKIDSVSLLQKPEPVSPLKDEDRNLLPSNIGKSLFGDLPVIPVLRENISGGSPDVNTSVGSSIASNNEVDLGNSTPSAINEARIDEKADDAVEITKEATVVSHESYNLGESADDNDGTSPMRFHNVSTGPNESFSKPALAEEPVPEQAAESSNRFQNAEETAKAPLNGIEAPDLEPSSTIKAVEVDSPAQQLEPEQQEVGFDKTAKSPPTSEKKRRSITVPSIFEKSDTAPLPPASMASPFTKSPRRISARNISDRDGETALDAVPTISSPRSKTVVPGVFEQGNSKPLPRAPLASPSQKRTIASNFEKLDVKASHEKEDSIASHPAPSDTQGATKVVVPSVFEKAEPGFVKADSKRGFEKADSMRILGKESATPLQRVSLVSPGQKLVVPSVFEKAGSMRGFDKDDSRRGFEKASSKRGFEMHDSKLVSPTTILSPDSKRVVPSTVENKEVHPVTSPPMVSPKFKVSKVSLKKDEHLPPAFASPKATSKTATKSPLNEKPVDWDGKFYDIEQLREMTIPNLDYARREQYLSPEDFQKYFSVTKVEFAKMPKWKRDKLKRDLQLF